MSLGKDFTAIYSVVFKKTFKSYMRYILLVPLLIMYAAIYETSSILLSTIFGGLGRAGGLIAGLSSWFILAMVISDFLAHLNRIIYNRKLDLKAIGAHRMSHFSAVLSATAIPNIIIYVLYMLLRIQIHPYILMLFYLLYAVPEIIHQKDKDRMDIFIYGHDFIKENWHLWGLINLVFGLLLFTIDMAAMKAIVSPYASALYANGMNLVLARILFSIGRWTFLSIPLTFVLIFRGYLFKILSVSSRRKREYMRNIYGE